MPVRSESDPSNPTARSRARNAWKVFATVVTMVALVWVSWMLVKVWPDLSAHRSEIHFPILLLALMLAVLASHLNFLAFASVLRTFDTATMRLRELAHLYFTAQLLKHLPGRVWGIGYQWAAGGRIHSLGSWVRANIIHTMLATYFALWSAGLALGLAYGVPTGLAVAAAGAVGFALFWYCAAALHSARWVKRLPGRLGRLDGGLLEALARMPMLVRVRIFVLFALSWMLFYAAWYFNGEAYVPLGGSGGIRMCAYYMLAWFVGYVSLLTPSGLGVRELVFAWLAQEFPLDAVALMAVVGRVSLLAVDLILGLIFAPFVPRKTGES
jgi:glycosyltransferase 2 family protein